MSTTVPTYEDTAWGQVCKRLHAQLAARWPDLLFGCGPDGSTLYKSPRAVTFTRPAKAPIVPSKRAGHAFDAVVPTLAELWMRDPVEAEQARGELVEAINAVAHGRAGVPQSEDVTGGDIGAAGAKSSVTFTLRLAIQRPRPSALPTLPANLSAAMQAPDGTVSEEVTIP